MRTHIDREVEQISEMPLPLFIDLDGEPATMLHTHDATHDRDLRLRHGDQQRHLRSDSDCLARCNKTPALAQIGELHRTRD